jgi:hypothetical protein
MSSQAADSRLVWGIRTLFVACLSIYTTNRRSLSRHTKIVAPLYVSASFTPSPGTFTAIFLTHFNTIDYKCNGNAYCGARCWWRSWLKRWATSRKVAVSISNGVTGIFYWYNPSGRTMALGMTQPLTEMSNKGWRRPVYGAGSLILLESSHVQDSNGNALTVYL